MGLLDPAAEHLANLLQGGLQIQILTITNCFDIKGEPHERLEHFELRINLVQQREALSALLVVRPEQQP